MEEGEEEEDAEEEEEEESCYLFLHLWMLQNRLETSPRAVFRLPKIMGVQKT